MKYFILLLLIACKEKYPPPQNSELCTENGSNLVCNTGKKTYERNYKAGDICTNGDDYSRFYDYCAEIRSKLIKCERKR
jgi:hypothetical protein